MNRGPDLLCQWSVPYGIRTWLVVIFSSSSRTVKRGRSVIGNGLPWDLISTADEENLKSIENPLKITVGRRTRQYKWNHQDEETQLHHSNMQCLLHGCNTISVVHNATNVAILLTLNWRQDICDHHNDVNRWMHCRVCPCDDSQTCVAVRALADNYQK